MNTLDIIRSQYGASLGMLRKAIEACPPDLWLDESYKNRFWHIAYHVLFYTHLYLAPSEEAFEPWQRSREDYAFLGPLPWPPHEVPTIAEPYSRDEILEYWDLVERVMPARVAEAPLDAESGFSWLPFSRLELHFYNIRHVQHHAGQLIDRIRNATEKGIEWIGATPSKA